MGKKRFKNPISKLVYAEIDDFLFLEKQGIKLSSFFRQAVKAFKEDKFNYQHIEERHI